MATKYLMYDPTYKTYLRIDFKTEGNRSKALKKTIFMTESRSDATKFDERVHAEYWIHMAKGLRMKGYEVVEET